MGASQYMQKALLDWTLGGATPTRPSLHYVGLAQGTPSSISGSECTISNYARQAVSFGPAGTPSGSATAINTAAFTFSVKAAGTVIGIQVWDTNLASNSGNMLAFGLLSATSVLASGDTLAFASGALSISLS